MGVGLSSLGCASSFPVSSAGLLEWEVLFGCHLLLIRSSLISVTVTPSSAFCLSVCGLCPACPCLSFPLLCWGKPGLGLLAVLVLSDP